MVTIGLMMSSMLLAACAPAGGSAGWERSDGTAVVRRAVAAHGGMDRWRGFDRVSFRYRESWSFPSGFSNS